MKAKGGNRQLRIALIGLCTVAIVLGFTTGSIMAQDDTLSHEEYLKKEAEKQQPPHKRPHTAELPTGGHSNLAEAATNPIANLVQFQVQNAYSWKNHNSSGYSNVLTVQPVIPFKLPWERVPLLVTRTTLPYVRTPDLGAPIGRKDGFGDTNLLMLALPKLKTKGMQLGLGFNSVIPTAGDNEFTGSGKWQAGPSVIYINMRTPKLQWGMFAYQLWSVGSGSGGSGRPDVSRLSLQPFITKHFDGGWFVGSPDTPQTYDFESNKWTWALGAQAGRVQKFGKQPVKWFAEVLYNPEDNNGPT